MNDLPSLLPLQIMARRVFVSAAWLRAEAEAGRIPHLQAGSRFLFDPKTVERVLLERAQQTKESAHANREYLLCAGR